MKRILSLLVIGLGVFLGSLLMFRFIRDGFYPLASFLGACIVFLALVFLKKSFFPFRWLSIGIVLAVLFTVYPIFYTVFLSFTNMSGGHLLTKQQAIERISSITYTPDGGLSYSWTGYRKGSSSFMIVVTDSNNKSSVALPGEPLRPLAVTGDLPETLNGYTKMNMVETVQNIQALGSIEFGALPDVISVSSVTEASATKGRYAYNKSADTFTDVRNGTVYSPVRGTYSTASGDALIPGFMVNVGAENYSRFLGNDGYRKPMVEIILWNIFFALASVFISFALGLLIALAFEDLPGKRIIRSLLIIPYPIPVLVSIMVWRALLNEPMGLVTNLLTTVFGISPHFFTDASWARGALILINVYLSYPYFYILSSGALKSIPGELFEAARIDGAGTFVILKSITLPMVFRILGPLLIASFSFNFNNFTLIWGFNAGLPAMADTIVPMGHTDLLISFIYRLGFSTANAADYGFAAAITVMLFVFVSLMVFFQTLNSRAMKETV
jgi:ABC-type sugar transport system permease subunit